MERKNKIRVLKELRCLSALAKSSEKCVSCNNKIKEIKLENKKLGGYYGR